jgi:serine/threonine protein kinase
LLEYLTEKIRLEEDEAREIFKQILDTVNYCHHKGIIHRDLKLENILFSDSTRKLIKLIDFGVSGLLKGEKSKAGSIKYMAPEVVGGSNTESLPQLDVWSLGCVLYEMLTGEILFIGTRDEIKV